MEMEFYRCAHCGQIVAIVKKTGVPIVCCGEKMQKIEPGTTDAAADPADLQKMLSAAVDKSFNMCTVDGDTSTNDSIFLLANGASGVEIKTEEDKKALAGAICERLRADYPDSPFAQLDEEQRTKS